MLVNRRTDKIITSLALVLACLAVLASYLVAERFFENLAHLEDEQAFVWQAAVIARGKLTLPSPPHPDSFLYPFVIDYQGQRFGKYPLGWPAILGLGDLLGLRSWVNPLLAGLSVWLTFLIGKRIYGRATGLLAAGLTLLSPFFLTISGSLLSHPLGLALSGTFILAWLTAFNDDPPDKESSHGGERKRLAAAIASGLALGAMALTRPWTAVGIALPFAIHGIIILVRGNKYQRWLVIAVGSTAAVLASLHLIWQWRATGDPFLNLYTLWWDYDRIGFGPGHGVKEAGHTLRKALNHASHSFAGGFPDLFGWRYASLVFIPFGLLATWRLSQQKKLAALLVGCVFPSLVLVHLAYWVGSYVLGPRYYYEGLYSLTIFSAAGILFLGGLFSKKQNHLHERILPVKKALDFGVLRAVFVSLLVAGLVGYNLLVFLPQHLESFKGLYGVSRSHMNPFLTTEAREYTPALVIVHTQNKWIEYGTLLELANPFLDSPFIFVISKGVKQDEEVAARFLERTTLHYYTQEPGVFYKHPNKP